MEHKHNFVKDLIILTNCLETIDLDDCDDDLVRPALGDALVCLQDFIIEKDPMFKNLKNDNKVKKPETELEALDQVINYFNWVFETYDDYLILIQNIVFLAEQLKESLVVFNDN